MKYTPSYIHHHIVMRDFNGAVTFPLPDTEALVKMHCAIRGRDELGMAMAYAEFVGALGHSTPSYREVLEELVAYIRDIQSDDEYESFIYDLDSQGPIGKPMWCMSYRALRIVRDLARNRKQRIAEYQTAREHVVDTARRILRDAGHSAPNDYTQERLAVTAEAGSARVLYNQWATNLCREVLSRGVLLKEQGPAIIRKTGEKFAYFTPASQTVTLKRFATQQMDNAIRVWGVRTSDLHRKQFLCEILDLAYQKPVVAIPVIDAYRDANPEQCLYNFPLDILSQIHQQITTKEKNRMSAPHDTHDDPRNAAPYSLEAYAVDVKAAFDAAEQRAQETAVALNEALEQASQKSAQAGHDKIVAAGIKSAITQNHMIATLNGLIGTN